MISLALCLLHLVGVNNTVMRAPVEPAGGNIPEAGVTVKSLLLLGRNAAVNGFGFLEPTLQIYLSSCLGQTFSDNKHVQ